MNRSMNGHLVSIIVPVYNAEKNLHKTLDSILSQSYSNWELILIDDGSIDLSAEIIAEYAQKEKRIRYLHQVNSGPSHARNKGIDEARGKYLTFIDADDWVRSDYLEKLVQAVDTNVDLICAGYFEVNKKYPKGLQLHDFLLAKQNRIISKEEFQSNLFDGVSGVLWAKLFKAEILRKHNIRLNENLKLSEDLVAVMEYSHHIKNAFIVADPLYYYNRLDESGLSGKLKINHYKDIGIIIKEIKNNCNEWAFLEVDHIIRKRKYDFVVKLLKDQSISYKEFTETAKFVVDNFSYTDLKTHSSPILNATLLKWIFSHKCLQAWLLLKTYTFLRKIKNG